MSAISSVAPSQPFAAPPPTPQTTRTTTNTTTAPDQESGSTPAPTTSNGRLVNLTA